MKRLALASIQPPNVAGKSADANAHMIDRGFEFLQEALEKGVAFACLPEFFNVFGLGPDMPKGADNYLEVLARARQLAARFRSHLVIALLVPEDGSYRDRAYLIGDDGEIMGHYDKIHPTLGEKEQLGIAPGGEVAVFETRHGRVAIVICYDIYFPELFARLSKLAPEVIFLPSLQRSEHEMASEAIVKARAMDTQAYLVRSSYGSETATPWQAGMMFGQSCVVHPDGTVLANAGHYEGFAMAQVPMPFAWQRRRCGGYPTQPVREFLREDRRPEVYRQDERQA